MNEAIKLLTGMAAGELDDTGNYPAGTINPRIAARVTELIESFARAATTAADKKKKGGSP